MAPADQYIIQHIDGGAPSDYDRVITYSSEGIQETDGWYLHLQIQPLHEDEAGYSGIGKEVVELFYGGINDKSSHFADLRGLIITALGKNFGVIAVALCIDRCFTCLFQLLSKLVGSDLKLHAKLSGMAPFY